MRQVHTPIRLMYCKSIECMSAGCVFDGGGEDQVLDLMCQSSSLTQPAPMIS